MDKQTQWLAEQIVAAEQGDCRAGRAVAKVIRALDKQSRDKRKLAEYKAADERLARMRAARGLK